MEYKILLSVCATLLVLVAGNKFLAAKPDYLNPCKINDNSFSDCYAKNLQAMFSEWKGGVPGLKSFGTLDPVRVKSISISQPPTSPAYISAQLNDITITGLGGLLVKHVSFNPKKFTMQVEFAVPKIDLNCDYVMKGQILNLALDGKGKGAVAIENSSAKIAVRLKLREDGGLTFTDVDKLRMDIYEVGGMHLQLDDLFNGNRDLEDSANAVFNESWSVLFEILRPNLSEAFGTVLKDRMGRILAYVPAEYLFDDLPSEYVVF